MYVNVPVVDQRTQVGTDGKPPEDGNMDCVPASLAAMASALLGTPQNADAFHDRVYGQGFVGLQNPAAYVSLLASLGIHMQCYTGPASALVTHAIASIRAGQPVLLSIPSDWDHAPEPVSRYAHMVAGCDVDSIGGLSLTAMNPWGVAGDGYAHAAYQTQSAAWWVDRLARCAYQGIWVLSKVGDPMAVPAGWTDDGKGTLTAPNGVQVVRGFRDHILAAQRWNPALVPLAAEYPASPGVRQDFALSLVWSAASNTVSEVPGQAPAPVPPPPAPAPPDPVAAAAKAALAQVKQVLGEL